MQKVVWCITYLLTYLLTYSLTKVGGADGLAEAASVKRSDGPMQRVRYAWVCVCMYAHKIGVSGGVADGVSDRVME